MTADSPTPAPDRPATVDLARLRDLAAAATAGEWKQTVYKHGGSRIYVEDDGNRSLVADTYHGGDSAWFAAANPSTVLALCDTVERQAATIAAVGALAAEFEAYESKYGGYPEARAYEDGREHAYEAAADQLRAALSGDTLTPLHEVSCPSCGATIRARMADQP